MGNSGGQKTRKDSFKKTLNKLKSSLANLSGSNIVVGIELWKASN
jgi:hypothetical protein